MKKKVIVSPKFLYYAVLVSPLTPVIISLIMSIYFYQSKDYLNIVFFGLVLIVFIPLFLLNLRKSIYLEITENDKLKIGNIFIDQEVSFSDVEYVEAGSDKIFFTISIKGRKHTLASNPDLFEVLKRRLYKE